MKIAFIAGMILFAGVTAWGVETSDATVAVAAKTKVAKVDTAAAKAQKQADNQLQKLATKALAQPLVAQIVKVDATTLTVKTQPMMGPDGLIASKEKTYDTTNATVVVVNGETKTLADLTVGAAVRVQITEDGKTAEHIESKSAGAKKAAAVVK